MRTKNVFQILAVLLMPASTVMASEGRIPIYETGTVISESGHYILTRDLPVNPDGPALSITARRVTLDLNGFSVNQAGNTTDPGIRVEQRLSMEVLIRNGNVKGGKPSILALGNNPSEPDSRLILENIRLEVGGSAHCVEVEGVSTVHLTDSSLRGCTIGVRLRCSGGCGNRRIQGRIEDNTFLQTTTAIHLIDASTMIVSGNRVLNESYGSDAIKIENSRSMIVSNNSLGNGGIVLTNVRGSDIRENTVEGSLTGNSSGIVADASSRANRFVGNVIEYVNENGIMISGTANYVTGNTTNHCGLFGLNFAAGADDNYYRENQAIGNGGTSCTNPIGSDVCLDGANLVSGGDNHFAGSLY